MKANGLSDVGRVRQNNEDNFFCESGKNFFIVADGLGGHSAGEIASAMAVGHVVESLPKNIEELVKSITEANAKVHQEAKRINNDMATTMSAMLIENGKAFIAHVGDSRIYLIREDSIYCITDDHTPVMESLRAGLITVEQAKNHPLKHMLSRTIGTHNEVEIDALTIDLVAKDIFVLCTDGLSNMLDEEEIYAIVKKSKETDAIVKSLVEMGNQKGGGDNITVVSVEIEEKDMDTVEEQEKGKTARLSMEESEKGTTSRLSSED